MIKLIVTLLFSLVLFIGLSASILDAIYGGGDTFPDLTQKPILSSDKIEIIANLEYPPGNISVSKEGRIFFTFHPEAKPPVNIAELVDGQAVPLQIPEELQLSSVLSLRVDRQNRLWLLDFAEHGMKTPQIAAIDLNTMQVLHHYEFPSDIAGMGSHLNDFQVSHDGKFIYIAEASILRKNPALILYDVEKKSAQRLLEGHESVEPDYYVPLVDNEKMLIFGVFAIRPGVDSIALDRQEKWLYFAPVTDTHLFRISISDLHNKDLSPEELANRVEKYASKSMSDGISTDDLGNIYISDLEHSAINRIKADKSLETVIQDDNLRWPDGLSFGPDGWLYVTNSALNVVIGKPNSYVMKNGPYQIIRFKPDASGFPGH